jgi:hypothetical protein
MPLPLPAAAKPTQPCPSLSAAAGILVWANERTPVFQSDVAPRQQLERA